MVAVAFSSSSFRLSWVDGAVLQLTSNPAARARPMAIRVVDLMTHPPPRGGVLVDSGHKVLLVGARQAQPLLHRAAMELTALPRQVRERLHGGCESFGVDLARLADGIGKDRLCLQGSLEHRGQPGTQSRAARGLAPFRDPVRVRQAAVANRSWTLPPVSSSTPSATMPSWSWHPPFTRSSLLSVSPRGPIGVTSLAVCTEATDLARATRGIVRVWAHMTGTPWNYDRTRCNARPGSPHRSRAHGHRRGLPCSGRTWRLPEPTVPAGPRRSGTPQDSPRFGRHGGDPSVSAGLHSPMS